MRGDMRVSLTRPTRAGDQPPGPHAERRGRSPPARKSAGAGCASKSYGRTVKASLGTHRAPHRARRSRLGLRRHPRRLQRAPRVRLGRRPAIDLDPTHGHDGHERLDLGPSRLPETRDTSVAQRGVTLTEIKRGVPDRSLFWTEEVLESRQRYVAGSRCAPGQPCPTERPRAGAGR